MSAEIRIAIDDALAALPPRMTSPAALVMLWAIGLQESNLTYRRQHGNGPARGLWQFERGGGVRGVLTHPASRSEALRACDRADVPALEWDVWNELESNDVLAATFARLLLWTDPHALPVVGDAETAWELYLRTWRPGAHTRGTEAQKQALREKWQRNYLIAVSECGL